MKKNERVRYIPGDEEEQRASATYLGMRKNGARLLHTWG
jgi:hypothetical protein